jgi:ACS family glucarate transporter-like MFS transporter
MPGPSARASTVRYWVLSAACGLAVIAYVQRIGFQYGVPEVKADLGLSNGQVGYLTAAFLIAYGVFQVPAGALGDRYGGRLVLTLLAAGSSLLTAAVALTAYVPRGAAWAFGALLALRFLFGALQAGLFPAVSRALADWMPVSARASAIGSVWTFSRLGGACAPFLFGGLFRSSGTWAAPFWAFAGAGLLWCMAFWPWYRDRPDSNRRVNAAELDLIAEGRTPSAPEAGPGPGPVPWRAIVGSVNVWALGVMYGCVGFAGNFFTNLLPLYLRDDRHLSAGLTERISGLVLASGLVGCLAGGFVSDAVVRATGSRRWGRRLNGCVGLSCAGLAFLATLWVHDARLLGLLFCLTFFFNDLNMAPAWAACADVGERYTGTIGGAMNMTGQFTGAAGMTLLGRMIDSHGAGRVFFYFACSYGLAALSWLMIDVTRPVAAGPPVPEVGAGTEAIP